MSSSSSTPPDGYFNDLSQPTGNSGHNKRARSESHDANGGDAASGGEQVVPKPKRIACIICRKRKLKCDGIKPSCSTCTRLGHNCAYDEVRRKSGPKRGYVKALEERLTSRNSVKNARSARDNADTTPPSFSTVQTNISGVNLGSAPTNNFNIPNNGIGLNSETWGFNGDSPQAGLDPMAFSADMNMGMGLDDNTFTWEMIGLGLEEPLPPQETIDELHQIYFDKIHPSMPMIHKYRYLAAMNLAPGQRPPVALRYAIWTTAASVTDKYLDLKEHFYQRARKYMELDVLKGHGENMISIAHAQTHSLLASYEFKMMYFPRAWMSTGAAVRLCQMMGLHRLDGVGLDVKQCLPPPRDWTEREERRRTFWMAFCQDRYASIGTGWPMTIDERDILTDLPSSDEAFEMSKPETTQSLADAISPMGAAKLSPFAGVVLMACLFGRNLIHLHRPDTDDRDNDLNGEFWKRHRAMDNILLNTSLSMPNHLKLPNGLSNSNIVFTNMNIHTSTICLHQAAIYKADKNHLPASVSSESKVRCISAANEVASIMRMVSHLDLSAMNPFISFCLYVAARVFVQFLKSRPDDSQTGDSLRFLLSAMNALKRKNPLTESFLVQLDVDLEGLGMRSNKYPSVFSYQETTGAPNTQREKGAAEFGNECNLMRNLEPIGPNSERPITSKPRPDPQTMSSTESFGTAGQEWIAPPTQGSEANVERTLTGLTLGGITRDIYLPDRDGSQTGGYVTSDTSASVEAGLSPDTGTSSSNRPTPNSSSAGDSRPNLRPGQQSSTSSSYAASPSVPGTRTAIAQGQGRILDGFFSTQPDYSNIRTGMTPDSGNVYTLPETPGRAFDLPADWEMSPQNNAGLTPVGEGVFRQLLGLSAIDPMDMGWEGPS